jgi:hypothetical protein
LFLSHGVNDFLFSILPKAIPHVISSEPFGRVEKSVFNGFLHSAMLRIASVEMTGNEMEDNYDQW